MPSEFPRAAISRRTSLRLVGTGVGGLVTWAGMPISLARAATEKRFVVVILRGALDGLAAVPPYADRDYNMQRGALAFADPDSAEGALDLDGKFGLNPALRPLHEMYRAGEMLVVHAVASSYRSRSHFDGQDLLENGTMSPRGAGDGWLNRALALIGSPDRRLGLAVGQTVPLLLRGSVPVGSWAPQQLPDVDGDFLAQLAKIYRRDPALGPALAEGLRVQKMSDEVLGEDKRMPGGPVRGAQAIRAAAGALGKLLAAKDGPRIGVLQAGGWDTHANQGVLIGRLAAALKTLADALATLKTGLGPAWRDTVVAVVTEFGRTVAINGSNGTDHGTAGVAFLLGGSVNGGRVVARWPGLGPAQLFEGRDLAPTTDLRAVIKGVLADHLGLLRDALDRAVFPDSESVVPLADLVRA